MNVIDSFFAAAGGDDEIIADDNFQAATEDPVPAAEDEPTTNDKPESEPVKAKPKAHGGGSDYVFNDY